MEVQIGGGITKFGLRNFKAFHFLEELELRPLTVLVGANSAGKSSLLQSLLLLKQTLQASQFTGRLKYEGDWVHLGRFENVVSNFDVRRTIGYRFTLQYEITTDAREKWEDAMQWLPSLFPQVHPPSAGSTEPLIVHSEIQIDFATHPKHGGTYLKEFGLSTRIPSMMTEDQAVRITVLEDGKRVSAQNMRHYAGFNGKSFKQAEAVLDKFWPQSITFHKPASMHDVLGFPGSESLPFPLWLPMSMLTTQLTSKLEYLGPLRAAPLPFYPVEETTHLGISGEKTVPYLLSHQRDKVKYHTSLTGGVEEGTLLEATNHWLRRMNVTEKLTIDPVASIAYVAAIQSSRIPQHTVDLSQVGFGVSQILPVLVSGLKGPDRALLLLEQPEIHLHPRLQGELAEFLLCVAQAGRTVVVETHSDHLINRLRRCIAEDQSGKLADMVSILFVHPGTQDNPSSYVEELEIDNMGNIVNWPPDFLSEAANESLAILRAGQQKAVAARP